jgi:hypothetical protein
MSNDNYGQIWYRRVGSVGVQLPDDERAFMEGFDWKYDVLIGRQELGSFGARRIGDYWVAVSHALRAHKDMVRDMFDARGREDTIDFHLREKTLEYMRDLSRETGLEIKSELDAE